MFEVLFVNCPLQVALCKLPIVSFSLENYDWLLSFLWLFVWWQTAPQNILEMDHQNVESAIKKRDERNHQNIKQINREFIENKTKNTTNNTSINTHNISMLNVNFHSSGQTSCLSTFAKRVGNLTGPISTHLLFFIWRVFSFLDLWISLGVTWTEKFDSLLLKPTCLFILGFLNFSWNDLDKKVWQFAFETKLTWTKKFDILLLKQKWFFGGTKNVWV